MFSLYLVFLSSLALILCSPRALRLIFNGNDDRWPTQCMSLVVMSLRILINSSTMRRTTHYAAFTAASLFRRSLSFSLFSSLFSSLPHSLSIFLLLFLCLCLSFSFSLSFVPFLTSCPGFHWKLDHRRTFWETFPACTLERERVPWDLVNNGLHGIPCLFMYFRRCFENSPRDNSRVLRSRWSHGAGLTESRISRLLTRSFLRLVRCWFERDIRALAV